MTTQEKRILDVLIVDDSPEFLGAACSWLETLPGIRLVGTAADGAEAVAVLASVSPDVVLVDAFMPVMDGFETTRTIKRLPDAPLVVLLSVHEGTAMEHEAWAAGADAFVSKREFATKLSGVIREISTKGVAKTRRPEPAGPRPAPRPVPEPSKERRAEPKSRLARVLRGVFAGNWPVLDRR